VRELSKRSDGRSHKVGGRIWLGLTPYRALLGQAGHVRFEHHYVDSTLSRFAVYDFLAILAFLFVERQVRTWPD
jgi:hypothetical protein